MVCAILDGRKTQTRRVIKPQYENQLKQLPGFGDKWQYPIGQLVEVVNEKCPFGQVGDRLWVRETFCKVPGYKPIPSSSVERHYDGKEYFYRADNDRPTWASGKWTPSIHMPRAASRITLEITGVRVERLQDISEEDAIAEGVKSQVGFAQMTWFRYYLAKVLNGDFMGFADAKNSFKSLWQSVYSNWDTNPWVWVIEFKRVAIAKTISEEINRKGEIDESP